MMLRSISLVKLVLSIFISSINGCIFQTIQEDYYISHLLHKCWIVGEHALFSRVVLTILLIGSNSLMTVLPMPIMGDKVERLDIFTLPGSILYKAIISLSVLHPNAFFFISASSILKESKPNQFLFSIISKYFSLFYRMKNTAYNDCVNNQVVFNKDTLLFMFQNWFMAPTVVSVGEDSYQSRSKMNWSDPEFHQH